MPLRPTGRMEIPTFAPTIDFQRTMTKHWFTCKVKRVREDEHGNESKVTDLHVLDAYNYTEAEARMTFLMQQISRGPFEIQQITKSNFQEVIRFDDEGHWYRVKVAFVSFVEESGVEKSSNQTFLINANDVRDAYDKTEDFLKHSQASHVIASITYTKIMNVYPLSEEDPGDRVVRERGLVSVPSNIDPETGEIIED